MADRLTVPGQAGGAVGQVALVLLLPNREAQIGARAQAMDALAALRREQRDDVIPRPERVDAVAHALDNARAFMPKDGRRVAGGVGAGRGVEVRVADAAGDQADEHFTCLRLLERDLLDDERRPELFQHCGPNLHAGTLKPGSV